ncbi:tetratricopeptide repeat protein [Streptomyces chartreusis]|uniref:tetratricopeptide repeat protein n=1 Tax=Streptomyces chartreusis TaxID=1969 RepID=UPI002E819E81|nr:tetratricopeptide repeat protein [Streptomyces chartreusis]WUB23248.1 tetratricopeptide repeat protein [Streptomyces chartreusis]
MPGLLRRGEQPWQGLAGFIAVVVAGCVAIAAAITWLSGPWAAGVGAAVTAVYGLTAELFRPRRRSREETDLLRDVRGRIPRARQVTRPEAAGVRAAEGATAPPYVPRDAEQEVVLRLQRTGFVLLVGESAAGKSRLGYEVARSRFGQYRFVAPRTRAAVPQAVACARSCRRAVVWLDDLENYLGRDGITATMLRSLSDSGPGHRVVLGTMRVEEYRRFEAREESRLTGSDRDAWRTQREVLQEAHVIRLPRRWSEHECRRAAAHADDARIAAALHTCDRFGIAETIAAGPELMAAWQNAWAPGTNPRAAALVTAAVDCRRAGLRSAVTGDLLQRLHEPLTERGGSDLRPEPLTTAFQWACTPALATSGLLLHDGDGRYQAFDYLINTPRLDPIPDHLWNTLLAAVGPEDAYDLGLVAHQQARLQRAITALTKAHEGSVAEAEFPLALALGDGGHPRQAAARLRRIAGRPGNDPLFTLAARHQAAFFTGESGAAQQAVRLFGHIVTSARTLLDGPHPDVLDARHQLAYFTGESGNTHAAAHQFRALLNDRERHHPDDHQQIIATRRSCIWFATRPGTLAESEHAMHALLDEATALIGADAPHTPAIRSSLATFAARAGRHDEALERFAALIGDRIRLLEPEHPHVLRSRLDWVHALAGAGHTAQARTEVLSTLHTAETVLETEHRHLRYARTLLEQLS